MKVKCPKCRLRFDIPTAQGITEVQCNCPRCGTPFTYSEPTGEVDGDDDNSKKKTISTTDSTIESNWGRTTHDYKNYVGGERSHDPNARAGNNLKKEHDERHDYDVDFYGHSIREHRYAPHHRHGMRHTVNVIMGFILVLVVAGLFAYGIDKVVGHFTEGDEATMEQLAIAADSIQTDSTSVDSTKNAKNLSKVKAKKNLRKNGRKEAGTDKGANGSIPKWIQGSWRIMTDNNYISIHINGNKIKVSDFYHTNSGHVSLQGNTLVCHFRDGRTFTYTIDSSSHRIIDGHGSVLQR